jgi:hypothetical protein
MEDEMERRLGAPDSHYILTAQDDRVPRRRQKLLRDESHRAVNVPRCQPEMKGVVTGIVAMRQPGGITNDFVYVRRKALHASSFAQLARTRQS